jgi:NADH dehydrogenase [ubiquinone] 1 alpha subcomplex assembly factor 7
MKIIKPTNLSLDKFIRWSLYDKDSGYYMKKNPFGKKGDFITAPNISRFFSEMVAIWVITFWQNLGSPKKFNLIELGAGNGEMMKVMMDSFKNFPEFFKSCNIIIHEKSEKLISDQKKNINHSKIVWLKNIEKIDSIPTIFLANEFFDAIPIKQFFKKKDKWFERYVNITDYKKAKFINQEFDIKKLERELDYKISKNQKIIEYSPETFEYLKKICEIIQINSGGMLMIDYGYSSVKMKDTLQAVTNHKFSNVLENISNSDITHNINFNFFKKLINKFDNLNTVITNQRKFLISMGIVQRAEMISKNLSFLKKADIFYRIKRLLDQKQMGHLFKVMLVKSKKDKFKTGF